MDDEKREEAKEGLLKGLEGEIAEILGMAKKLELTKSEDDLKMIEKINFWLEDYLTNIGAGEFVKKINPNQLVVLSDDDFVRIGRDVFKKDWSFYSGKMIPGADIVFMKRLPEKERFAAMVNILHELVHVVSKFGLRVFENENGGGSRSGYFIKSFKKEADGDFGDYEYFDGLNESIVQMVTLDILEQHTDELEKDYSITKEEQKEFKFKDGYAGYEYIYMLMAKNLAEKLGLSPRDYGKKFRKNLFTGNLMFLRDVEKFFGKGSLRVLAFMGSHASHARDDDMIRLFEKYFSTESQAEREEIAEKIFNNEEDKGYFEKYKKRLGK